jgi:two-component system OmpR family response regulator
LQILYCTDRATDTYLVKALRERLHTVEVAQSLEDAITAAAGGDWRAVVCDLQHADTDTVGALSDAAPSAWLLIISAESGEGQAPAVLRAGADALFVRPYAFLEFGAKLDALSRYAVTGRDADGAGIQVELSASDRAVWVNGDRIELGRRQFALLDYLIGRGGAVAAVEEILDAVWADLDDPAPALVHSAISALRARLERDRPLRLLHGHRGRGYSFRLEAEPPSSTPPG